MAVKRGEIWWADLAEPRGSEPGDRRPVLIVQDDHLTASALSTVMVVPLTTNLRRAAAVGNVPLSRQDTGLARESVALVCQVMTLDKAFLDVPARRLPARIMRSVDVGLRLTLSLDVKLTP
jgi:mRNA interferase MazF